MPHSNPRKSVSTGPDDVPKTPVPARQEQFPLVGIGCSAGGLEALEKFFTHVPLDRGMAFVVVQHLAPDQISALPDLLQHVTPMHVCEAGNGMVVKPGCVYVIPPNKDLSLLHGKLHLLDAVAPRGQRLAVDFFFRTLAEDRHAQAIGVILSGMGSDGVFGLRAIKEKGGLTLVQEPAGAQSDSMPRSAIEAGVVDVVAPAEELPARIAAYLRLPASELLADRLSSPERLSALDKIIILLRDRSGNDFSLYKTNTLYRRIERRMALHQLSAIDDYLRLLRGNPHELDLLFKELLIGVTNFFRDPAVWEYLRTEALPALLVQHGGGKALRAWVPACSSGEEAYSLAIVFREVLEQFKPEGHFSLQIYATDLDPDAIDLARKGVYHDNIAADVSEERLARYFVPNEGGGYRIGGEIREMVIFAPQNIINDPPFTKLDLLSCRNLLIYFGPQLQKKLFPLFHFALNRGGLMLLGSAETVGGFGHLFAPVNNKARIYRRLDQAMPVGELVFPGWQPASPSLSQGLGRLEPVDNIGTLTDQLIQQTYAPAAVLVNAEGDIVYISGRTGKYLEPAAGKVNMNIYAMAREGLREALTGLLRQALREPRAIRVPGIQIKTEGGEKVVNLIVQAVEKPEPLRGRIIIVFEDVAAPPLRQRGARSTAGDADLSLMQELQQTREALRVTHEEMQIAVEELRSSNEELQSTNEELQSANEELMTSKEELQSLNEELQTVNAELQSKVDDLTWVRNDMANLLNSTEIATVFLDNAMNLRRFTTHATRLFKLIQSDIGRPLMHVVTDLDYPRLREDVQEVLRTLVFQENVLATHDGRWYRVRIMPYRTLDNVIDGVVITFTDVTEIKQLEAALRSRGS